MKLKQLIFFATLFLIAACANRVVPTGGPKDILPPKFIVAEPINGSVNFKSREIVLSFSEYLQLKDLPNQLLVSPLMDRKPEVKVSKKSIVIKLPEKLRDNTTYTINFGKAIADLHEGNAIENFQYVFSTGPILDSLICSGIVKDAATLQMLKDVTVMLYKKSNSIATLDSLVFKQKPDYFAHTNENGSFEIKNIAPGYYSIFALEDKNGNYILDNPNEERMAFTGNTLTIPQTGTIELKVSKQHPSKRQYLKSQIGDRYRATLIFNERIDTLVIRDLVTGNLYSGNTEWSIGRDSLYVFMKDSIADSLHLLISSPPFINDTIQLKLSSTSIVKRRFTTNSLRVDIKKSPEFSGPTSNIEFELPRSLGKIEGTLKLFVDTIPVPSTDFFVVRDSSSTRKISVTHKWKEGSSYQLLILPGTFTDVYGSKNDTINYRFKIPTSENTAAVTIHAINLKEGGNYLLQVLTEKYEVVRQQTINKSGKYDFNFIYPGAYIIRVVVDNNKNNMLDGSNYLDGTQPEEVFVSSTVTLRANWELELELNCASKE